MPDLDNNKVDIDTSGPAMDVDIAEEKDSAEIEQPEVKEEPTVRAVEEETTSEVETKTEENVSEEKTEEPKKDELQDYSDSVQKRIAKLTKKWREAERQKDEALTYAKSVLTEKQKAEQKLSKMEPSLLKTTEDSIKSGLESAKAKLAAAREAGDIKTEVDAQKEIARLGVEEARVAGMKQRAAAEMKQIKEPVKSLDQAVAPQQAAPDPRAEEWAEKNSWFGQDSAMTYTAFDLHEKLTKEEGFDPATDEYYAEVDKRMRLDFPHKFGNTEPKETTKPTQTVASATRSVKPGRNTVRLTSSQVAIAKKLGVPLEEYAKQLKITKEA